MLSVPLRKHSFVLKHNCLCFSGIWSVNITHL